MRIIQVDDNYESGGASIVMRGLGEELTRRGHEIYFATGRDSGVRGVYRIHHLTGLLSYIARRLFFFNADPISQRRFAQIVRKIRPDLIHCHNLASYISLEIVKVSLENNVPCVVTVHDFWPVCINRTLLKGSLRKPRYIDFCKETGWARCALDCKWEGLKKAPNVIWGMSKRRKLLLSKKVRLIAVSRCVKTVLERFGYPEGSVNVVYNGVDTDLFKPSPRRVPGMVLYASGDPRVKGAEHFIEAARRIERQRGNVRFVMLGLKASLLPNFVENPGRVAHENMANYYESASCTCVPSLLPEAFSLVAVESMACARPVIAYASGGLTEIVKNGETGLLVERGNVNLLGEKILWILDNPHAARNMGLRAREFVEKNYSLQKMSDQYEGIYHEMISADASMNWFDAPTSK